MIAAPVPIVTPTASQSKANLRVPSRLTARGKRSLVSTTASLHRMNVYLEPLYTELRPCSVPAALAFALRLLADRLERKSIQVDISGDSAPVRADQEMLHRVFIHILGYGAAVLRQNGMLRIQNSQSGGQTHVTVTLHPADPGPAGKNGRSLPFEDEEQNLSTCSRLVERMHGGLHVEHLRSTARITVSLPGFQQRANAPAPA